LRPIYRTAREEVVTQEYGPFRSADSGAGKRLPRNQAIRTLRVSTGPGYAVGAIKLRTSIGINGMSLTFMRIKGETLDPRQSYASPWIGSDPGGREASLNGGGAPIVGVFGNLDEQRVLALGISYIGDGREAATSNSAPARLNKASKTARSAAGSSDFDRFKELLRKEEMNIGKTGPEDAARAEAKPADPEAQPADPKAKPPADPSPVAQAEDDKAAAADVPHGWQNWKATVPVSVVFLLVAIFLGRQWRRPGATDAALLDSQQSDAEQALLPTGAAPPRPTRHKNQLLGHKVISGGFALAIAVSLALIAYDASKKTTHSEPFQEFTSAQGNFRVEIPGTPRRETALAAGISFTIFHVEEREGAYGVAYADVPMVGGLSPEQIKRALDSARDGMVANVKGKFLGESSIKLDGAYLGREIRAELPTKDGMMIGRLYVVKHRLYMVLVTGLSHWVQSANAKRFLDSLEVRN
jgi:hypothetical protein